MKDHVMGGTSTKHANLKERVAAHADLGQWSKIGAIGERIFYRAYTSSGVDIKSLHNDGADFVVDGGKRVDVKTRTLLMSDDVSLIKKVPKRQRMKDTVYAYVAYQRSNIRVYIEDDDLAFHEIKTMAWEEAESLLDASFIRKSAANTESNRAPIKEMKAALSNWVQKQLNLQSTIIYRSNKFAQDSMEQRGWGADNFEQRSLAASTQQAIVILLFVDAGDIYKLYAYPTSEIDSIDWNKKPVGPNPSNSSGFDPRMLSDRYKFADIADFKENVRQRFAL